MTDLPDDSSAASLRTLFSGIRIIRILAETDDNVIKGILTGPFRRNSPISKNAKT
jgi:hypothetical protein